MGKIKTATENAPIEDAPIEAQEMMQVRVLVACVHGQPDDVISLPATEARQAEEMGQVDSNQAAVDYALSLKSQAE